MGMQNDLPEGEALRTLAIVTALRESNCSYWIATDEQGNPEGSYMVVCVIGPQQITDLKAATDILVSKWDLEEDNADSQSS